jgi:hypothetical protein
MPLVDDDPLVIIAHELSDRTVTYRLLFTQTLALAHRQSLQIAHLEAAHQSLRDELARYTASMVGA